MNKKLVIHLGIKILNKFGYDNFIIYIKATKTKLNDYKDYISKFENDFIIELWQNKKYMKRICELKGSL